MKTKAIRGAKRQLTGRNGTTKPSTYSGPDGHGSKSYRQFWWMGCVLIVAIAATARLWDLDIKPFHNDEGVNGVFVTRLFRHGVYRYNPREYHGPTLYYFALIPVRLLGLHSYTLRLLTAFFGIFLVGSILCFRNAIGRYAVLVAAAFLAISPGAVFYARDFIHESLFVCFTAGLVLGLWNYLQNRRAVWLLVIAVCSAFLFATKETAIMTVAVIGLAAVLAVNYERIHRFLEDRLHLPRIKLELGPTEIRATNSPKSPAIAQFAIASALFLAITFGLYSSFGKNLQGIPDSFRTFAFWADASIDKQTHPWYQYIVWIWQEEAPLMILGTVGAIWGLKRSDNRFAIFVTFWLFGMLLLYSSISYKTPWLVLNFLLPLVLLTGYAISSLANSRLFRIAIPVLAVMLLLAGFQTLAINFFHYDDYRYAYTYAQTQRGLLNLLDQIQLLSAKSGAGKKASIAIFTRDYWPIPWYLRDYSRVKYYNRPIPDPKVDLVIGSLSQEPWLQEVLGDRFKIIGYYPLRPGVVLSLYARQK